MPTSAPLPTPTKARSMLANAVRRGDKDGATEARRLLAAANLEQYIKATVAKAPPLTEAQAARISALLRSAVK